MKSVLFIAGMVASLSWWQWWFTPDQQGDRLLRCGEFAAAAEVYRDPMRVGVAWYQAGEFEKAEQAFAGLSTPDAEFNRGNCLVLRGKYEEAIERYDRALELRPDWNDAETNRQIAVLRARKISAQGGDMGDQRIGADEIKFDRNGESDSGQEMQSEDAEPMTESAMQALWLRKVQTKPADFLRSKFSYQLSLEEDKAP